MMIDEFIGEYYFLSNFSYSKIELNGFIFDSGEAAFHSFKDISRQSEFVDIFPLMAKRKGRRVSLRSDWEQVKDDIMYQVVKAKFEQNDELKEKLLATENQMLVEGNTWNDTYWGICQGKGFNVLGVTLMLIRHELRGES